MADSLTKQNTTSFNNRTTGQSSILARALAEQEQRASVRLSGDKTTDKDLNPFTTALLQNNLGEATDNRRLTPEQEARLRQTLHDQVQPVEQTNLFSAKEQADQAQLEQTRLELAELMKQNQLEESLPEVDSALQQPISNQGSSGAAGAKNHFHHLGNIIDLARKSPNKSGDWLITARGKQGRGSAFAAPINQTKKIHQQMAAENNFGMNQGA